MNNFKVKEVDIGERHLRYYILRNIEDRWYMYTNLGQDDCAANFLCKLLNDHEEELLAFEEEYYEDI